MRILYIEDSICMAELVIEQLKEMGHNVTWFDNRDQAHAELDKQHFDFCLSDFNVPFGKFADTQTQCQQRNLPLLLLSGEAWGGNHQCPHSHFLSKLDVCKGLEGAISMVLSNNKAAS